MKGNGLYQKCNENGAVIMSFLLCKSPFIRDINLETRGLPDDVLVEPSHQSCVGTLPYLDHILVYHFDSDELNSNTLFILRAGCEWIILEIMLKESGFLDRARPTVPPTSSLFLSLM